MDRGSLLCQLSEKKKCYSSAIDNKKEEKCEHYVSNCRNVCESEKCASISSINICDQPEMQQPASDTEVKSGLSGGQVGHSGGSVYR